MAQTMFPVLMSPELQAQVEKAAGPRKRSEWIRQACILRLKMDAITVNEEDQPNTVIDTTAS